MKPSVVATLLLLAAFFSLRGSECAPTIRRWDAVRKFLAGGVYNMALPTQLIGQDLSSLSSGSAVPYCSACKASTTVLRTYLHWGLPQSEMTAFLLDACERFDIETPRVCRGLVDRFKDEFFYVLARSKLSTSEICGMVFPDECPYGGDVNWTVPWPARPKPPVTPVPLPPEGAPTLRVLHISDTHVDPEYHEGSEADCNEPLCCHAGDVARSGGRSREAGHWGAFETCDIPARTFENMLKNVRDNHKIDYVIWTGDMVAHNIWNTTRARNLDIMQYTVDALEKYLPGVPIFPALGNHEGNPVDSFPIPAVKGNRSVAWLYDALASQWSQWLPESARLTTKSGAFYAVRPFPGLKIISLNMNYCNTLNWWLLLDPRDPAEQLAFLVNELEDSESKGEKVHIIGHIPPGQGDCLHVWSANYNSIIRRFESTVRAQFFGHTHNDELELFYELVGRGRSQRQRPYAVAYVAPSTTTFNSGHPAFRIYVLDGNYTNSTWAVLDHETYLMNVTEANLSPTREPLWQLEYTAKSAWGMTSLQPKEWDALVQKMESDVRLFNKFYRFHRKEDPLAKPCDSSCRRTLLCKLRTSKSADLRRCLQ
ncbi:sphingomyelin phosphodiesterase-like [Amblyomma americanum]